jgi:hypothetical protein
MGRTPSGALRAAYPQPYHKGSAVRRFGVRMSRDGTREVQRYHCAPVRPAGVPEDDERYKAQFS